MENMNPRIWHLGYPLKHTDLRKALQILLFGRKPEELTEAETEQLFNRLERFERSFNT